MIACYVSNNYIQKCYLKRNCSSFIDLLKRLDLHCYSAHAVLFCISYGQFKTVKVVDLPCSWTMVVFMESSEISSTLEIGKLPQKSKNFWGKAKRSAKASTLNTVLSVFKLSGKDCLDAWSIIQREIPQYTTFWLMMMFFKISVRGIWNNLNPHLAPF